MHDDRIRVTGRFCPPLVTHNASPVPLGGDGTCTWDAWALHFEGHRTSGVLPTLAFAVVTIVALVVLGGLAHFLRFEVGVGAVAGVVVAIALGFGRFVAPRTTRVPMQLEIQWIAVDRIDHEATNTIVIHVRRPGLRGAIYFQPAIDDARGVVSALRQSHGACRGEPRSITC